MDDDLERQHQEFINRPLRDELPCDRCANLKLSTELFNESFDIGEIELTNILVDHFIFREVNSEYCSSCVDLMRRIDRQEITIRPRRILGFNSESEGDDLLVRSTFQINPDLRPLLCRVDNDSKTFDWGSESKSFGTYTTSDIVGPDHIRHVGDTPNYDAIKVWLGHCLRSHKQCNYSGDLKSALEMIFLIDIEKRQVVTYPKNGEHAPEYFALSYVWGGYKGVSYKPHSTLPYPLPQTIEDAIFVTKRLKLGYLWVDAVCIDQDDDVQKKEQISLMASIYRGAVATIIPLSSNTSDDGFPRVHSGSRRSNQLSLDFGHGKCLQQKLPRLADAIHEAKWNTRCWTFQEKLLSHRRIYFTDHQVHLSCAELVCCEAWHDETHYHNNPEEEDYLIMNPPNREDDLFTQNDHDCDIVSDFENIVNQYLERELEKPEDILHAFSGILEELKQHKFPDGFHQGLPKEDFQHSLLWRAGKVYGVMVDKISGKKYGGLSQATKREFLPQLPSWSWISWRPISGIKFYRLPDQTREPEIYSLKPWVHISDTKQVQLYEGSVAFRRKWEKLVLAHHGWSQNFTSPYITINQDLKQDRAIPAHRSNLHEHARLCVEGIVLQLPFQFMRRNTRVRTTSSYTTRYTRDLELTICDHIISKRLDVEWHFDRRFDRTKKYEEALKSSPLLLLDAYLQTDGGILIPGDFVLNLELLVLSWNGLLARREGTVTVRLKLDRKLKNLKSLVLGHHSITSRDGIDWPSDRVGQVDDTKSDGFASLRIDTERMN
ncbi:heterokaryon incompatibility protein-domain-containing protein [Truncatella angustata]|uniref:Heterokaryon incompatibility protein-domain-containing protein n=1 Tax=Truncatella angustata TaxID=152316 RepID=A0A9P8UD27_9PEZI|nr:heterokaryon incompatibility protein-domain-containing protein [Truncatella angustata]KAH6646657.1 heterokaryon incompatibility protein-domain-containing protein [Truncatella angustata]